MKKRKLKIKLNNAKLQLLSVDGARSLVEDQRRDLINENFVLKSKIKDLEKENKHLNSMIDKLD